MFQQSLLVTAAFAATALAQVPGEYTPEVHPNLSSQVCRRFGGCHTVNTSVVLDSNYRWLHNVGGYNACKPSNFDPVYCPNITACAQNCALEGAYYASTGIITSGSSITLNLFKENGTQNSSPRVYMLQDETHYVKYMLLGKEFTYDVDVSKVPCGVNGALYFSEMSGTGDASALNTAGAKYGTG
jgi:cellulose 1,4-beta-cellobiosidase